MRSRPPRIPALELLGTLILIDDLWPLMTIQEAVIEVTHLPPFDETKICRELAVDRSVRTDLQQPRQAPSSASEKRCAYCCR